LKAPEISRKPSLWPLSPGGPSPGGPSPGGPSPGEQRLRKSFGEFWETESVILKLNVAIVLNVSFVSEISLRR